MVLAVALLTFASIFTWTAAPAMAAGWVLIENAGSHHWMTDYKYTSVVGVGNPIVASRLDSGYPASQSWRLDLDGPNGYHFVASRQNGTQTPVLVAAHVDGLAGAKLTAQSIGFGSHWQAVQLEPEGPGSELWAFVTSYTTPPLAITSSLAENQSLYLEEYKPHNPLQHWLIYNRPNPNVSGRPTSPQELRPATLDEVLAEAKEN